MQQAASARRRHIADGSEEARPLAQKVACALAHFDRPRTTSGTAEIINRRFEHLHGTSLGPRNRTHYAIRSLIHFRCLKDHLKAAILTNDQPRPPYRRIRRAGLWANRRLSRHVIFYPRPRSLNAQAFDGVG